MQARQLCRNCKDKLKHSTEVAHKAFCTVGCYHQFFRHRCVVCETSMERHKEHQRICGRKACRQQLRAFPMRFTPPMARSAIGVIKGDRNLDGMRAQMPWRERPSTWFWVAGPEPSKINLLIPIDPDTDRRVRAFNRAVWEAPNPTGSIAADYESRGATIRSDWKPTGDGSTMEAIPEFLRR